MGGELKSFGSLLFFSFIWASWRDLHLQFLFIGIPRSNIMTEFWLFICFGIHGMFILHLIFSEGSNIKTRVGQLLQGVVKSVDKTRKVVHLSSDPDLISKSVVCSFWLPIFNCQLYPPPLEIVLLLKICFIIQTKDLKGISIDLLVPGMMVNARVRSTLENGIMLTFLTYFTGTVSMLILIVFMMLHISELNVIFTCSYHLSLIFSQVDIFNLGNTFPTSNWNNVYAENKKVMCSMFLFNIHFASISVLEFDLHITCWQSLSFQV